MTSRYRNYILLFIFFWFHCFSQTDSNTVIRFDFNDHQLKEAHDKLVIKPVGVTLANDRFGNKNSAAYLHGDPGSYINLGTSDLLKPVCGTIAMWVNMQSPVFYGKGYDCNPLIIIKNGPGEDYILAYGISYGYIDHHFNAIATKDSMDHVTIFAKDLVAYNTWNHLVITSDDNYFAFYINGELQLKMAKGFKSSFHEGDSVMIGRTTGSKNIRYTNAIIDDIIFFHRVLSEKEIQSFYNEPNPNLFKNTLYETLKYGSAILVLGLIILIILIRNKRNLKRQKEYYELNNKVQELEIKVIRAQMNPHFISNCLAAIQNLIYNKQIEEAALYLARFNALLRQVLDYSDKNYITLYEELKIIQLNVELEQLRFKDDFTFALTVEKNIDPKHVLIPSLVSQPFIENAIWHGLLPLKTRSPKLSVRIFLKQDYVYLSIEDNGVGRAKELNASEQKPRGTRLAADKLESMNRLSNSSDYRLEIKDLTDEMGNASGTQITIRLSHYNSEE